VQVDPVKPTLNAPGTQRLKLKDDRPLSSYGFEINLRRSTKVSASDAAASNNGPEFLDDDHRLLLRCSRQGLTLVHVIAQLVQLQDTFIS